MIRQRVLYVGIGGSGLDLGIMLDEALRRQICGLDGRALTRKGAVFAGFQPHQLPNFIQSVYIDFAADSLENVTRAIKGGNAHAAGDLIPTIDNYPALALDLRMNCDEETVGWIPAKTGEEPNTRPLNGGAGQFPTVGRAAMFHSIKHQGYEAALGKKLSQAISLLTDGSGQIDAYTDQRSLDSIAVYVGFSLSGGTGCGLFMDILYLLTRQLKKDCPNNRCVIVPIVMLPSTFGNDLPPDKNRRAQLNAAPALLDLVRLLEQLQSPQIERTRDFEIRYPDPSVGRFGMEYVDAAPTIPVISVVAKGNDMDRDDVMRSVAAAIVTHASSSIPQKAGSGVGVVNENSFIEDLINDIPDISRPHPLGLGTHPLMPMVASSLTMPSRQIADLLAQRAMFEGFASIASSMENATAPSQENIDEFLGFCGLGDLVRPNVFSEDTNLKFAPPANIKSQSELDQSINKARSRAAKVEDIVSVRIEETIRQKSVFDAAKALPPFLRANPDLSLPRALSIALAALNQLETRGAKSNAATGKSVSSTGKSSRKGNPLKGILPQRVSPASVAKAFQSEEEAFTEKVREMWWTQWGQRKVAWSASVENGRDQIFELQKILRECSESAGSNVSADKASLAQRQQGVVNFVPTEGRSIDDFLDVLYDRTCERIRETRLVSDKSSEALLKSIAAPLDGINSWADFVNAYLSKNDRTVLMETVLTPLRDSMESAMTGDGERAGTLKNLSSLLREASQPQHSKDSDSLLGALADLVPDTMIPSGEHRLAKVLISYPGEHSKEVEDIILSKVRLGASLAALIDQQSTKLMFTATGDGDVITVNVNIVGQGILDHPETRNVLQYWATAVDSANSDQLQWRQRLGYKSLDQLFSTTSRDLVMAQLLKALVYGGVRITRGTEDSPERLEIGDEVTSGSNMTRVELDVAQPDGISSWPNVLAAYERLVLSLDPKRDMRKDVVRNVMNAPTRTGRVSIPQVVRNLLTMRETEMSKLRAELMKENVYGPVKLRELRSALEFWETTLPGAFDHPVDGFKSLAVSIQNSAE
jgi:hypothetical protein